VPPPAAVISAHPGDTLTLAATVTNAVVPYAVSYDTAPKLFQLVSGSTTVPVGAAGPHVVGWAFNELPATGWTHRLTARVNGGGEIVLLDGSAAGGDDGFANGHATVVVA
jgi:hypothetical protein